MGAEAFALLGKIIRCNARKNDKKPKLSPCWHEVLELFRARVNSCQQGVSCFMKTKISYSEKLRDPRWQKKRLCVMQRDGFACRDCGDADSTLHVHHCHYEKGEPWQTDDRFLLTLCEYCHESRGDAEQALKVMFGELLASTPKLALYSAVQNHSEQALMHARQNMLNDAVAFGGKQAKEKMKEWFVRANYSAERSK